MRKTFHFALGAVLTAFLLSGVAWAAGQLVDQGRPGTQGPWPVTCVSGCGGGSSGGGGVIDGGIVGVDGTWFNGVLTTEGASIPGSGLVTVNGADDSDVAHVLPVTQNGSGFRMVPVGGQDRTGVAYQMLTVSNVTSGAHTTEAPCVPYSQTVETVTNAAGNLTFATNTNYVTLCNSQENSPGTAIKCMGGGTAAVFGTSDPGDYLNVGDCVTYPVDVGTFPNTISCIANAVSAALTTSACGY